MIWASLGRGSQGLYLIYSLVPPLFRPATNTLPSAPLILCFNFLLAYIRVGLSTSLFLKQIKEELIVVTYPSVINHSARCHSAENSRHFWYRRSLERYSRGACTVAFISGAQRSNRSSLGRVDQRELGKWSDLWNLGDGLLCGIKLRS
jgi:hypothetical protein